MKHTVWFSGGSKSGLDRLFHKVADFMEAHGYNTNYGDHSYIPHEDEERSRVFIDIRKHLNTRGDFRISSVVGRPSDRHSCYFIHYFISCIMI
jgi:hypothetical protein